MVGCLQAIPALCVDTPHWAGDSSSFLHTGRHMAGPAHIADELLHIVAEQLEPEQQWAQVLAVDIVCPVDTVAESEEVGAGVRLQVWALVASVIRVAVREEDHQQMDCWGYYVVPLRKDSCSVIPVGQIEIERG